MKTPNDFFRQSFYFLMTVAVFVLTANAQSGVDLSFNAAPTKAAGTSLNDFEIQPDDKILTFAFNGTRVFGGVPKSQIARLNYDGTLDNSFDCASCDFNITSVRLQTDGKLIVAGALTGNGFNSPRIRRLNFNGSLDGSFTSPFAEGNISTSQALSVREILPNGKILVLVNSFFQGYHQDSIYRLNTDGSFDSSFTTISFPGGRFSSTYVNQIKLQSDGKILASGNTGNGGQNYTYLYRFNADGALDATFESPAVNSSNNFPYIYDFESRSDGSIVFVGKFDTVNSISRNAIAKLLPAGNLDTNFPPTNSFSGSSSITQIKILPDGKILIGDGETVKRLNADGSRDSTFSAPAGQNASISKILVDGQGKILIRYLYSDQQSNLVVRLNSNGSFDNTFNPATAVTGSVTVTAGQPDGKVLVGGDFDMVNNIARYRFARVNADGSADMTLNVVEGFNAVPTKLLVQADGKILAVGNFSSYNGTARFGIIRLNADGSVDGNFAPVINSGSVVNALASGDGGKIYIGGNFTTVNGQSRNGIARLNGDGSLDANFNPTISNNIINSILVQTDGKVAVGGTFSGVNGFNRTNLVRFNIDGSLDAAFNAGSIQPITQIEAQTDGKYIVSTGNLFRLNANGTSDSTFQSPSFSTSQNNLVINFVLQSDASIIVGGNFNSVNGTTRLNLTRIKSDGSLDLLFLPNGANGQVNTLANTADGKILVGGNFTVIGGVNRIALARLMVTATVRVTPFDFDGDGRADVSVFRPSNGFWYTSQNAALNYGAFQFGQAGDKLTPADYDGDGKTDVAVVRGNNWYIQRSSLGFTGITFGNPDDIPVPADYDGDGKADVAVFRPSNGTWYLQRSSLGYTSLAFGSGADKPVPADYDGDGKAEIAVYRPSNGFWYNSQNPATNYGGVQFGIAEDKPVPADYDGDGKIDRAVFRPSNGTWYLLQSTAGFTGIAFGFGTDIPVAADYDGDERADIAVVRNGSWYLNRSTAGFTGITFGFGDDKPIPNSFVR